jgi:hypothetical protein
MAVVTLISIDSAYRFSPERTRLVPVPRWISLAMRLLLGILVNFSHVRHIGGEKEC